MWELFRLGVVSSPLCRFHLEDDGNHLLSHAPGIRHIAPSHFEFFSTNGCSRIQKVGPPAPHFSLNIIPIRLQLNPNPSQFERPSISVMTGNHRRPPNSALMCFFFVCVCVRESRLASASPDGGAAEAHGRRWLSPAPAGRSG